VSQVRIPVGADVAFRGVPVKVISNIRMRVADHPLVAAAAD
jgi:hypothetical protein